MFNSKYATSSQRSIRSSVCLVLIFLLSFMQLLPAFANNSDVVRFADPVIEAAVRDSISKPAGDLTKGDVSGIRSLMIETAKVTDLSGIENLTALGAVRFINSPLSDISKLAGLPIYWVDFSGDQISDISVLGTFSGLQYAYLKDNHISNVDALKGKSGLGEVELTGNPVAESDVQQITVHSMKFIPNAPAPTQAPVTTDSTTQPTITVTSTPTPTATPIPTSTTVPTVTVTPSPIPTVTITPTVTPVPSLTTIPTPSPVVVTPTQMPASTPIVNSPTPFAAASNDKEKISSQPVKNTTKITNGGEATLDVVNQLSAVIYDASDDGKFVLAGSSWDKMHLIKTSNGISKDIDFKIGGYNTTCKFSPDGKMFACLEGDYYSLTLFETNSGKKLDVIPSVNTFSFSSDSKSLILTHTTNEILVVRYDIDSQSKTELFNSPKASRIMVTNSNMIAIVYDNMIQVRDLSSGNIIKTLSNIYATSLGFSPDGKYFVASETDKNTYVYDVTKNLSLIATLKYSGPITFSSDSQLLIIKDKVYSAADNFVSSYNLKVNQEGVIITDRFIKLSNDDKYLIAECNSNGDKAPFVLDASKLRVKIDSISFESAISGTITMNPHSKLPLKIVAIYTDGSKRYLDNKDLEITVDDAFTADVKDNDLCALANGKTKITASYEGLTATADVNIAESSVTLKAGILGNAIKLGWSSFNNSQGISGYNLYRHASGESYDKVFTDFVVKGNNYIDSNITSGETYSYVCKVVFEDKSESGPSNEVTVNYKPQPSNQLTLQINNPVMQINGSATEVDPNSGAAPTMINGRTMLPIRAIIKTLGGTVGWIPAERKVTVQVGENLIELFLDNNTATVNGLQKTMDVPPTIVNGRTMLPLRFVGENIGCKIDWNADTRSVTINY